MKRFSTVFTALAFVALAFNLNAQTVVDVLPVFNGDAFGALNAQIAGDTLADGSHAPNRIYKLQRDAIYYMSGKISTDYTLRITADPSDADHKPPVIASGVGDAGEVVGHLFALGGDASISNVMFTSSYPTENGQGYLAIQLLKDKGTYLFDNCIFQGSQWLSIGAWAVDTKVSITNCTFRNVINPTSIWNGRGFSFQNNNVDSLVMVNNTFFNNNSFALQGQNCVMNYAHFENNTLVNSVKWPIQWESQTNAVFSNNIFHNIHALGESAAERTGQDIDGQVFGIINLYNLTPELLDSTTYTEAGREVKLENNNWFYDQKIQDFWASIDSVDGEPFMNTRTAGLFANSALLVEANTTNMDPQFENAGETSDWSTVDAMISWMKSVRDSSYTADHQYWGYEPDGSRFMLDWPLPENLHYTNATLATAGTNGCPVGDLNWWPAKKDGCTPAVAIAPIPLKVPRVIVSNGLSVEQNMPNPFKGHTTIAYSLDAPSKVSVNILDINGRIVTSLLSENQTQGRHTIEWNTTNQATGTYFYQVVTGKAVITRKLELIK